MIAAAFVAALASAAAVPAAPCAHSGAWSCRMTASGLPTWTGPWQRVTVPARRRLEAAVWVRGHGETVRLMVFDAGWKTLGSTLYDATPEWSRARLPFATGDRTAVIVALQDAGAIDGNADLDDAFVGEPGRKNLLANPGFEAGPSGWADAPGFAIRPAIPVGARTGFFSLRFVGPGVAGQAVSWTVTASAFAASAWVRGAGVAVRLEAADRMGRPLAATDFVAGPDWARVATPWFAPPSDRVASIQLKSAGGPATLFVDDVRVGPDGGSDAMRNGGFEAGTAYWSILGDGRVVRADRGARMPPEPPAALPSAGPALPPDWRPVFDDEFTGEALDRTKWLDHLTCFTDHLNDELERYRPYGVVVGDGVCRLRAMPAELEDVSATLYSSGVIVARTPFRHGYAEARFRLPKGKGFWPAFWLTSADGRWPPEWDILEVADVPGRIYGYQHPVKDPAARNEWVEGAAGPDAEGARTAYGPPQGAPAIYDEFVTYGCLWTDTDVIRWVNGRLTEHWKVNRAAGADDRMWLLLNLAVGGKWPGSPDRFTPWPGDLEIDYVRVWGPPPPTAP